MQCCGVRLEWFIVNHIVPHDGVLPTYQNGFNGVHQNEPAARVLVQRIQRAFWSAGVIALAAGKLGNLPSTDLLLFSLCDVFSVCHPSLPQHQRSVHHVIFIILPTQMQDSYLPKVPKIIIFIKLCAPRR